MADNLGVTSKNAYSSPDEGKDKPLLARQMVLDYYNEHSDGPRQQSWTDFEGPGVVELSLDDVYITWFSYTLGNWKAMLSTTVADGRYYEVIHNREKDETYLDEYQKQNNVCIPGRTYAV